MSHGFQEVTLQSTQHEVILHALQEITSERQVISHDPSVAPMVLMVQNGRKCIDYKRIVDLRFGRHEMLLNSKRHHNDLHSSSVNMKFTAQ